MKGDVGMADHEKGRKQGVAYPIPTSLSQNVSKLQRVTHSGMNQVG